MRIFLLLITGICLSYGVQAQKPQLLVYGNDALAFGAAVQAASSGVPTVWVTTGSIQIGNLNQPGIHQVKDNQHLDAGLWASFLEHIAGKSNLSDSALNRLKSHINGQLVQNAVQGMIDSLQNLHHLKQIDISNIQQNGKKWKVQFSNNTQVKVLAIVDGSSDGVLSKYLEKDVKATETKMLPLDESLYKNKAYRTSLFPFDYKGKVYLSPFETTIQPIANNFFSRQVLHPELQASVPAQLLTGQVLGAASAYGAFFKTSSDAINIRRLQGELLAFGSTLIPFLDIPREDPHFMPIQRIAATGLFQGQVASDTIQKPLRFEPDKTVSTEDIKVTILALYTRSQIWFQGKNIETLSIAQLMDLIKFTALKGNEIDAELKREWSRNFHFRGTYDPENLVNRRQAAVILDHFLHPFKVNINKEGDFVY